MVNVIITPTEISAPISFAFMFSIYLMLKIIVKIVKIIDEPIIKAAKKFSFGFIFFILIKFKLLLF